MAQLGNVVATNNSIGNREDLSDVIYRVVPEETPFVSNIGKSKATGIFHEWQTETLDTPSASNAAIEGNVFTIGAGNLTTRIGNQSQILTKTFAVSRTEDVVKKAGRTSETNRQKTLKMLSLRRDMEMSALANQSAVARNSTTAGVMGGALAWMTSNTSLGATGANGTYAVGVGPVAATNGTLRAFTETQLKAIMVSAFNNGGKPSQVYMSGVDKQAFSAFTGIATIRHEAPGEKQASLIGAEDVYVSDYGNLAAIPHPYGLTRDALFIDPTKWAIAELDGIKGGDLPETADGTQYKITWEGTLESRNQLASGVVRDLL